MGPDCCSIVAGKTCPYSSRKKEDDVYSCLQLVEDITINGWDDKKAEVASYGIVLHPCGRYTVSAGQHRVCIMRKNNMVLPKVFEETSGYCKMHSRICDKYFSEIDQDLYFSGDFKYVVDENGRERYNGDGIYNKLWYFLLENIKYLQDYTNRK